MDITSWNGIYTDTTTEERIINILVDKLGVDAEEVMLSTDIANDLRADDLDFVEIIMEIEKEWKELENTSITKSQLKEMLFNVYEKSAAFPHAQIRSLQEIGKLYGQYTQDLNVQIGLSPEAEARLNKFLRDKKNETEKK